MTSFFVRMIDDLADSPHGMTIASKRRWKCILGTSGNISVLSNVMVFAIRFNRAVWTAMIQHGILVMGNLDGES